MFSNFRFLIQLYSYTLQIYDREDILGEKLDTVKGSIGLDEKRFRSTSGTLTISFKSDGSIEDRGFSGYFRLISGFTSLKNIKNRLKDK